MQHAAALLTLLVLLFASLARCEKPSIPPDGQAYWGITAGPDNTQAQVGDLETAIGRKYAVHRIFFPAASWNSVMLPDSDMKATAAAGRVPMVSLKPKGTWKAVADGSVDAWLISTAKSLKAWGMPMWLTIHHEPEDDVASAGMTEADFVNMWRHVHSIFVAQGVTNIAWHWIVMGSYSFSAGGSRTTSVKALYPGDDVVDWIGSDSYNWINPCPWTDATKYWRDLHTVLDPFYTWASSHNKPLSFPEFGCNEDTTNLTRKASWFQQIGANVLQKYPKFKALVYFNRFHDGCHTWPVETSRQSLASYAALSKLPQFRYFHSTTATTVPPTTPATTTAKPTTPAPSTTVPATTTARPTTSPPLTTLPAPTGKPAVPPNGFAYWGALVNDNAEVDVRSLETAVGRPFAVHRLFFSSGQWDSVVLPNQRMKDDVAAGRVPMVSLKPSASWKSIAAGNFDTWLTAQARNLKIWGKPMWLTVHHEPEDDVNSTAGMTETDYRNMWRHVHSIFVREGATNVAFNWIAMSWSFRGTAARVASVKALYPGDDVVDWLSIDAYNWISPCPGDFSKNWADLENLVDEFYAWASPRNKPLSFPEIGCKEDPNNKTRKAAWFSKISSGFMAKYPKFKAFVYFSTLHLDTCHDWPVDTTANSLAAFASWGKNTKYGYRMLAAPVVKAEATSAVFKKRSIVVVIIVAVVVVVVLVVAVAVVVVLLMKQRRHAERTAELRVALANPGN